MTLNTARAHNIHANEDGYGYSDYDFDEQDESAKPVNLKLVDLTLSKPGHEFNAFTVPSGTFMAKAYTTLKPESPTMRPIKGSNKKSGSGKTVKPIVSALEAACHVKLVISVITQSLNDATPHSIIMDISGHSSTAAPDIAAVFDAVHFFRSDRLLAWTSLISAEHYGIQKEFERQFSEWVEDRGVKLANKVIHGVLEAMKGHPSGLTPDAAGNFMKALDLVEFWCGIAGVDSALLFTCLKVNINKMKIKRNENSHKVVDYKLVRA